MHPLGLQGRQVSNKRKYNFTSTIFERVNELQYPRASLTYCYQQARMRKGNVLRYIKINQLKLALLCSSSEAVRSEILNINNILEYIYIVSKAKYLKEYTSHSGENVHKVQDEFLIKHI